jgi:serine/threonine protein phosphatase 1
VGKVLVLLVAPPGAGKTEYCRAFLPNYWRSSQDEQGRSGHFRAFEEAIRQGYPFVVVDRTNGLKYQRRRYLELAKQHGYTTHIVWNNLSRRECLRRCQARIGQPTFQPDKAVKSVHRFFSHFRPPSRREADFLEIIGPPPRYVPVHDLTGQIGKRRHIILGDVHGCLDEMLQMLERLKFDRKQDVLISVGDIVDRGPKIKETIEFLLGLPEFYMVCGNHEDKLLNYLKGKKVDPGGGVRRTIAAYRNKFPPGLKERLEALPLILKTPSGYVVHAGFDPEKSPYEQSEEDCLYMRCYGGRDHSDDINGRLWYTLWPKDGPRVFFGHISNPDGPCLPRAVGLDGGCVFGDNLRAFDSRDGRVHSVRARRAYVIRPSQEAPPVAMALAARPFV